MLSDALPALNAISVFLVNQDLTNQLASYLCGFDDNTAQIGYRDMNRIWHQPVAKHCRDHNVYFIQKECPLGCPICLKQQAQEIPITPLVKP